MLQNFVTIKTVIIFWVIFLNPAGAINLMIWRFDDVPMKYIIKLTNHQIIKSTSLRRTLVQHIIVEHSEDAAHIK